MKTRILLIGGAGYIGTVITDFFLKKNYQVTCLDNFIFNNEYAINSFRNSQNYKIIKGDLRDINICEKLVICHDVIILLGGLVGDPITRKYPNESKLINSEGIKKLILICEKKNDGKLIFVSTCSNYGLSETDNLLDENSELKPLSLYAQQKVEIENFILSLKSKIKISPTILRFSTAFGLSPRMRFDLTINQFTKSIYQKEPLLVFDAETWRPYCHVNDFALALEKVIDSNKKLTDFQVFNVGGEKNNYTKKQITELILKQLPHNNKVEFTNKKFDPRNYRVNFSKIEKNLNFKIKFGVEEGIEEMIEFFKNNKEKLEEFNSNLYGNYSIKL